MGGTSEEFVMEVAMTSFLKTVPAGEILTEEGVDGNSMFLIFAGTALLNVGNSQIARLERGSVIDFAVGMGIGQTREGTTITQRVTTHCEVRTKHFVEILD